MAQAEVDIGQPLLEIGRDVGDVFLYRPAFIQLPLIAILLDRQITLAIEAVVRADMGSQHEALGWAGSFLVNNLASFIAPSCPEQELNSHVELDFLGRGVPNIKENLAAGPIDRGETLCPEIDVEIVDGRSTDNARMRFEDDLRYTVEWSSRQQIDFRAFDVKDEAIGSKFANDI